MDRRAAWRPVADRRLRRRRLCVLRSLRSIDRSLRPLFFAGLLAHSSSTPPPPTQPQAHRKRHNMSNGENVKTEGGAAGDHIVIRGTLVCPYTAHTRLPCACERRRVRACPLGVCGQARLSGGCCCWLRQPGQSRAGCSHAVGSIRASAASLHQCCLEWGGWGARC